jgi:hypothetical protein
MTELGVTAYGGNESELIARSNTRTAAAADAVQITVGVAWRSGLAGAQFQTPF